MLVHDDRDVHLAQLHLAQQLADVLGFGREVRLAGHLTQRPGVVVAHALAQHVFGVHDADDVVDGVLEDGDARVAVLDDQLDGVADRARRGRGDDVEPRDHDLAHRLVGHLEDAVDHLPLLLLDHAFLFADVDEHLQLLFRDERTLHAAAPGCGADQQARERGEPADDGSQPDGEQKHRSRQRQRETLAEPQRQ